MIAADKIPLKSKSGLAVYKNIFSSPAKPVRCAKYITSIERTPAKIRLKEVPMIAEELLELKPPTKYIVIMVDKIPHKTEDAIGQKPFKIIGTSNVKIKKIVAIIENMW